MPSFGSGNKAFRGLIWLLVILVSLSGILAAGVKWSNAQWLPKLGLDLIGGTELILAAQVEGDAQVSSAQLNQAVRIIRQRVDSTGVSEAQIASQGGRNIVVSLPGEPDEATLNLIKSSAQMEFRPVLQTAVGYNVSDPSAPVAPAQPLPAYVDPVPLPTSSTDLAWVTEQLQTDFNNFSCLSVDETQIQQSKAAQPMITCDGSLQKYILGPTALPGADIKDANAGLQSSAGGVTTNVWAVNLTFNDAGSNIFSSLSEELVSLPDPRNRFAMVLDGVIISAPTMNQVISNGQAQITGNFNQASAQSLADQLKYGALPISFVVQSQEQISATLGTQQLQAGLLAGLLGLLLVCVYSIFQYRLLGFVTIISLLVASSLTYLLITLFSWQIGYRLSLAGVAGLIVAIGMTADSFIVYFERIKEELREGKRLVSSVEAGWKRAIRTILASDSISLLAAVVLYFLAIGSVRGFAFTLGLTTVVDIIVVTFFTHPVMRMLARTKFFGEGHKFSGLDPKQLGVTNVYRGRFKVANEFGATKKKRGGKSSAAEGEALRRETIAQRKAAAAGKLIVENEDSVADINDKEKS